MLRAHGHLLDSDWSYLGIICLPNLPQADKPTMCRNMKICNHCADYILVGDEVNTGMKSILDRHFSTAGEFADESVWRDQYKKIASRILAMEHLRPSVSTVQRMAGTEREVVAAFTEDGNYPIKMKECHKSENQGILKLPPLRGSPARSVNSRCQRDQDLEDEETSRISDLHPLLHSGTASTLGGEKSSFPGRLFNRLLLFI